ncbi:MAG TPA: CoA transferase [Candidatus Sulfotelmatobacter sp.]|nr:CoA transferase [Candidatus Sulfotelmatobacter sp.]
MKLEGLRVIDLSSFLPGPYLTMTMADHGAEVIKIEAPNGGDPGRHIGLADGPSTVFFRNLNRGKKSVVLDLKNADERDTLLRLCDGADVLVESFRPGVAERLGIGYAALKARNPRLVYCSISAFGQTGSYRHRPAHDLALQAASGALGLTVGTDGEPAMPAIAAADHLSALQGLSAILMALLRRTATGCGDYIDIAMHDAMLAACANILGPTFAEHRQPIARHERTTGGAAFYQIYRTRDGRHIVLAGQEEKFVHALLQALGRLDLAPLCARGPGPHQQPVIAFLQECFAKLTLAEAVDWLAPLDVCFAPVNTLPEAVDDENAHARGMVLLDRLGRRHVAPAIRFHEEPSRPSLCEPQLGEHDAAVLGATRPKAMET